MRIGSNRLSPEIKSARPTSPLEDRGAGVAPSTISRDGLSLSDFSPLKWLKEAKQSIFDGLWDKLFGKKEAPKPPAPAPKPAEPAPALAPAAPVNTVRQKAEAAWLENVNLDSNFRKAEGNFVDVNNNDLDLDDKATALVTENMPAEQAKLATLKPEQQQQYQAIMATLINNPQGQLAMQVLLTDGKLTAPKPKSKDGDDLLGSLSKMGASMHDAHIDNASLLAQTVQEIAVPSAINQHDKTTCTVTSVQIMMASENPAEYARLINGLASPAGNVTMANGETLTRAPGTAEDDGSKRSIGSRLWQAAASQYAVGPGVTWDNQADSRSDGKWGIFGPELDKFVDALSNRDNALLDIDTNTTPAGLVSEVARHANAGSPVPVCMDWGDKNDAGDAHPGHDILVTKVTGDRVFYTNPWGQKESMAKAEFTKRVWWANPVDFSK